MNEITVFKSVGFSNLGCSGCTVGLRDLDQGSEWPITLRVNSDNCLFFLVIAFNLLF